MTLSQTVPCVQRWKMAAPIRCGSIDFGHSLKSWNSNGCAKKNASVAASATVVPDAGGVRADAASSCPVRSGERRDCLAPGRLAVTTGDVDGPFGLVDRIYEVVDQPPAEGGVGIKLRS